TYTNGCVSVSSYRKWIGEIAQYSELSHFIFITKTDTKSGTNLITFLIAFSGFAIGNGTC
ncbi:hypothetical protein V7157_00280, partial [Neobacillus drentensis]|uniref:hypothetical protein n=1 Tax=Neobacillus drentensis TaxID=220684 RepID=UPI003000A23B